MRTIGLVITNAIKIAGLATGLFAPHGAFSSHPEAAILALGGFMMAGAQLSEQTIVSMAEKFLGHKAESSSPPGEDTK